MQKKEKDLRTWTILTSTTSVTIQTTAEGGDPPETALVDIFCNRLPGLGRDAVAAVLRALVGSADDPNEQSIFST